MTVEVKYKGPVEAEMVFTAPGGDGELGFRRVRILAEHPDGGWIYEELPGRMRTEVGRIGRCPDLNLRIVFVPEADGRGA